MVRLWTILLISGAVACCVAWVVLALREKGLSSLQGVRRTFRGHPKYGRAVLGFVFCGLFVLCATKPQAGGNGEQGTENGGGDTNGVQMVGGGLEGNANVANVGMLPTSSTNGQLEGSAQLENGDIGTGNNFTTATLITSPNTAQTLDGDDFRRGFVLTGIGTDETFDFSSPDWATVCADWQSSGAVEDWMYVAFTNWEFRIGTNWVQNLRVFSFGKVDPLPPATNRWFAPLCANLGIVPQANWPMIKGNGEQGTGNGEQGTGNYQLPTTNYQLQSIFWHCATPSNTLQMTWQNILLDRATNTPVNVQMEVWPNGRFVYRYDLSRLEVEEVTNILVGASLGILDWTTNALPTNVTSLAFYPLTAEDAVNTDRDGDGLSLLDELFAFGTDPELWDTDFDGISDGDEVAAGVNPLTRDTDGDGLVDGSDPDPATPTSLADLDGDGIPDAYEDFWFGGTNAFNTATNRDGTGFTLDGKILGGINPTNGAAAATVASTNGLVSWKLFDGFAADWPANATNLVWERTFTIGRSSAWQQFFVSANPTNAAGWRLAGMALEWDAGDGVCGSVFASPLGDSFRIPLSTNDYPYALTLRLRAAGAQRVCSPEALYLIAYAPEFHVSGGDEITGQSGANFHVFLDGTDSQIDLAIDHSLRPCRAAMGADECDMEALFGLSGMDGDFSFSGDAYGGSVIARRPGVCSLPDIALGVETPVPLRSPRLMRRGGGGSGTIVVLDPSASWRCSGHGCYDDGVGYDWGGYGYYEEDSYPLDSKCLREGWYHDLGGGWIDGDCELRASSGAGDGGGYVTTSGGSVYVDGVEVWSGSPEHVYDVQCGGSGGDGGCESCATDCANGNCDALEGSSLGSLKFRIPLGAPVTKQVAGFVWFATEGPVFIDKDTFQLLGHPSATISETTASGVRRIVCSDQRGRDLRIEDIADGAQITIYDTAAQTLEHTWQVFNVNGNPSQVRLRKISRLNNTMSDETYTYSEGDWTRFDNIAGVGTQLSTYSDLASGGTKWETRTTTDEAGNVLESVTTEMSLVGEFDNAVLRETYRSESTGLGTEWTETDYWNDPPHSARHGKPRLVRGNARAWTYSDYDENGHLTLRIAQRGNAAVPSGFPYVISNVLYDASLITDAFVTVWDFTPHNGDSCHEDDAARPRTETRYVVKDGAATLIGRTWMRYTRLYRDAHAAIKKETWRAGTQGDEMGDASNAYSYEITYADTDDATPLLMRNAAAETLDEDGILTVNAYLLSGDVLFCTTRRYLASNQFPTYEVTERDSSYGTVLRRTVRLTDGDTIIEDEQSIYDSQNRLRSTTYLDGTSLTNAYSCCRLLWKRDREGRKVLRSAQTGTDHLYNAMEEVWLGEVKSVKCKMENEGESVTNGFRVTKHYFDALGRETNTVVGIGYIPGEAASSTSTLHFTLYTLHSSYPNGGNAYAVHTDERGKVTVSRKDILGGCLESGEAVFTNGVEVVKTKSRSYFGGGSSTRREWDGDKFTEECRFDEYDQDGRRVAYVVTESPDCGMVTNSISTYDLLGRVESMSVPNANGGWITTAYEYDGVTSRKVSATMEAGDVARTTEYLYDDLGEAVGTVMDGITNRTDVTYAEISNEWWRVETTAVIGPHTNSLTIAKTQLTGLSDALRRHEVTMTGRVGDTAPQTVTETFATFDPSTGIETETVTSSIAPTVTRRRMYGLLLSAETEGTTTYNSYDALGRVAATSRTIGEGEPLPLQSFGYSASGDLLATHTYTNGTDIITETYAYDILGNRIATTDALGNTTYRTYDPLGNVITEDGATYPVRYTYDTAGRRTSLSTTRDGVTWDTTTWTYDPRTSLCLSKTYADNSTVTYTYTPDNLPLRTTYASGRWKENVYDTQRRLCGVIYSSTNMDYELQLDEYGRTTFASNGVAQTGYVLNVAGMATNETRITENSIDRITRAYDEFDRLTGLAITGQGYAQYLAYSTNGLLASISNSDVVIAYDYSPDLKDVGYTMAFADGGTFASMAVRDPYRRDLVLSVTNSCGGNTHTLDYSYDALSRPVSRNADTFGYNARSEVSSANIGGNSETHEYDGIGNATFAAFNFSTNIYTANSLNQYTSILCDAATLRETTHDADGNLTFDGVFTYTYDADNRLSSVSSNGFIIVTNQYDHKGRRVRKTTPTSETTFLYDGWNLIYEREIAGTVTNETYYYWGKDISGSLQGAGGVGGLLYLKRNGTIYIPHRDANGNIVRYTDAAGNVVASYTYGAFGNTLSATGAIADVFHFRFSTKYYDAETGLYYYGYRFYSPLLMRWLNRDPIEENGGCNLYAFCKNAPLLYIDVQGEHPAILIPVGIAARAAVEAAVKAAIAAALALAAKDLLKSKCKSCRPCDPLVGTIGYRVDYVPPSKPHFPFKGTHTHLSVVMQSPPDMCRCFWHKIDIRDGVDIPPDAVPMNGSPGGGGVYYY